MDEKPYKSPKKATQTLSCASADNSQKFESRRKSQPTSNLGPQNTAVRAEPRRQQRQATRERLSQVSCSPNKQPVESPVKSSNQRSTQKDRQSVYTNIVNNKASLKSSPAPKTDQSGALSSCHVMSARCADLSINNARMSGQPSPAKSSLKHSPVKVISSKMFHRLCSTQATVKIQKAYRRHTLVKNLRKLRNMRSLLLSVSEAWRTRKALNCLAYEV